jgi:tetratricopeptide (TPR) repeat protein
MDLLKLGTKRIDPFPFTSRAYILEVLGADEAALLESKEALCVVPDYGPAYAMMGKIYNKRKDYKKAFEYYRLGAMYAQGDLQARLGLAQAYEDLKDYKGAVNQYQRVIDASPKNIPGYFGLARSFAEAGQDKNALDLLAQAKKLGLEDKVDVQRIHDIISSKKKKVM